jgi:hypothetical protein
MHLLERMNFTSGDFPREEDEFDWACLTPAPAAKVRPCRVAEAKAHLECEVTQIVTDRNTNIVLGRSTGWTDPSCSACRRRGRRDKTPLEEVGELTLKGLTQPVVAYNVPLAATQPAFRVIEGGPQSV